jgi:small subunit ribosomal protein S17
MKIFTGKVVSVKMQKTATVAVKRVVAHPVYKKRIRLIKKYQVHDEIGVEVDQVVRFVASKPFSKTKKWKIIEVVEPDKGKNKTNSKAVKAPNNKKSNTEKSEKTKGAESRSKRKVKRSKRKGVKK